MATAADNEKITQAVEETLEYIKKNAPEEFSKINADPKVKDAITEAARAAAAEQVKLNHEFASRPDQDIRERLAKHLPVDRIKLIEKGLSIPTFHMEIIQKRDGKDQVQLTRGGLEFLTGMELTTDDDIERAKNYQYVSILVEVLMLLEELLGIGISLSSGTMKAIIEDLLKALSSSSVLRAMIKRFISSWKEAGSIFLKAKAIFCLLKDLKAAHFLWEFMKFLCTEMSWLDWVKCFAAVTGLIIAATASEGLALIAEIALAIMGALEFAHKIANIVQLDEKSEANS